MSTPKSLRHRLAWIVALAIAGGMNLVMLVDAGADRDRGRVVLCLVTLAFCAIALTGHIDAVFEEHP